MSHLFKFDDPDDAGPLLAPLGENTLPVGNYRLTVNAYEYISDVWLGRKSLDFQIFNPDMPVFVPELGLLAVILVAAAVLFIYKRKK